MITNDQHSFLTSADDDVAYFKTLGNAAESVWEEGHTEGQLSVDVVETEKEVTVIATMAGTNPEDIELHLNSDFLTIRGKRLSPAEGMAEYHTQECYWGKFSRTIVLPVDVRGELARSEYKHGVLTIHLPKTTLTGNIPIVVVEE